MDESDLIPGGPIKRVTIDRSRFAVPEGGFTAEQLSVVTGACLEAPHANGRYNTVPGPDEIVEMELHIHTRARESE